MSHSIIRDVKDREPPNNLALGTSTALLGVPHCYSSIRRTKMKVFKKLTAGIIAAVIAGSTAVCTGFAATSTSWNFGNTGFNSLGTISSNVNVSSLGLYANSSKTMSVISDSQSLSGVSYSYALNLGGAGVANSSQRYRCVQVPVTKNGNNVIKVTLRSTGSSSRKLVIGNASGGKFTELTADTAISTQSYTYTGNNSVVYLYSSNSAINIYKIQVDSYDSSTSTSSSSSTSTSSSSSSSGSSTASGVITVDGSGSYSTLAQAYAAASNGSVISLGSGTFYETATTTLYKNVTIKGAGQGKTTLNYSKMATGDANRGIQMVGSSSTIQDLAITQAGDNGIYISGDSNTVKNVTVTKCQDTGVQISNGGSNNLIYNVTSNYNYDDKTGGENADGFAVKLEAGSGNVLNYCYANYNSDDGFDFYRAGNAVKVYNSQANYSGVNNGNGNGFKIGGAFTADNHYLENCTATGNKLAGFDQNSNTGALTLINCTGTSNYMNFYLSIASGYSCGPHTLKNCTSVSGTMKDTIKNANCTNCSFNT